MRFVFFPLHLSKVLRLARKMYVSRKIILANLKICCSKMQPLSGNQHPDLLTSLMNMSLVLRACHATCIFPDPPIVFGNCSLLARCRIPRVCPAKQHLNLQKWSGHVVFLTFWLGNVLRHNGVHFFDISTSKSAPKLVCFVHFDLEMCFAPQRRSLFRHVNFQKRSEHEVVLAFSLANVLRATTACTFSTCQLSKMLREWCALYVLTWKCASRRATTSCNFSSLIWPDGSAPAALASLLFYLPEPQITVFRGFPSFSRTCIFFLLTLSLLWSSLFSSLALHLCFSSVHIVGSLTSLNFHWQHRT